MNKRQIQKSSITLSRTTFLMLFLMRYQAQNLGKKLCSLGRVTLRVYQCFVFRSLGPNGGEVGLGTYACKLQKFIYSNEYFKTVRSKTYYVLNTSTRAVNNSSALLATCFSFVSLLYLFIRKKVLESNNEQAANTKIKLHSTSNNFFNALSNALSSAKFR